MSAVAKKRLTDKVTIKVGNHQAEVFYLIPSVASNLLELVRNVQQPAEVQKDWVEFSEVFPELTDPKEHVASVLRGARYKAGVTQLELAKKLNITQGDLSKMENGKRSIGKNLAQRLSKILNVDYRIFL